MAFNLIMSSANVVPGSNNSRYQYNFLNGSLTILDEAEIAISSFILPYSIYNVTQAYDNRSFSFTFPTSASSGITYNFTLAEGFYLVTDINAALQQFCILNGLYLINGSGLYVYYLVLLYNPTTYSVQAICQLVPTSLPAGWTAPPGWPGFNAISYTPTLTITGNNFGTIIGFAPGTYPATPQIAACSFLSTFTPLGSNVNSIVVSCNLVNNPCGYPTNIVDSFGITSQFGSNIVYQPPALKYIKLTAGTYQSLEICLLDQSLRNIVLLDNNVCISILIKNKGRPIKLEEAPTLTFRL